MINIQFNQIQIDSLSNNGAVFNGQNSIYGWNSHSKLNRNVVVQGNAKKETSNSINIIDDTDMIDMPIYSMHSAAAKGGM